ncbi:U-scoloptoxin(01)-Cw1a [Frankliniella fusca]|uniref:U-scoloptoxin(01)-Cw1a n=1 Tax=Frankliniella fusca TaxID=407009 RepID=A0AAE1I3V7_9NEOP|nr:U-scoloptoxin(01)-Cw1a [Frankliniella fusca]
MTVTLSRAACAVALLAAVVYLLADEAAAAQQKRQVYRGGFHQGVAVPVQLTRKLTEEEKEAFRAAKRAQKAAAHGHEEIPGRAGIDYPTYHEVPATSFSCHGVPVLPGMYANEETGCQAYHVCHDGREGDQGASFLCPNGTLFNQYDFNCDWWYNVDCRQARSLWSYNADPERNPYYPKKKTPEQIADIEAGAYAAAVQQTGRYQEQAEKYQQYQQYQQYPHAF